MSPFGETICLRTSLRRASRAARSTLPFFMTLTVAIDYQRDADALWKALERRLPTPRPDTCSIQPRCMRRNRRGFARTCRNTPFPKKPRNGCNIRRTVAITFHKNGGKSQFPGGLRLGRGHHFQRLSADTHLVGGHAGPDYPYLRGPRIDPLWLRMLSDNVGLSIQRFGRSGNSSRCSHCMCLVGDRNRPG